MLISSRKTLNVHTIIFCTFKNGKLFNCVLWDVSYQNEFSHMTWQELEQPCPSAPIF